MHKKGNKEILCKINEKEKIMDDIATSYLRVTSVLEIERAKSGHPGVALGGAEIIYSIYKNAFFNPKDDKYLNRDRIVFSAGHASALIYACLHLFNFDVSKDDLKSFRQLGSKTSGHPEVGVLPGIDASTGPLGQGIAMAVGLAIAEMFLANKYNKKGFDIVNHYTYCFCGDGCLMEGVAEEAIEIAGNLGLNKLILLYDKNDITIEGDTSISNKSNVKEKFLSRNWNVIEVKDGNCTKEVSKAINLAKKSEDKPTVIITKTKIGFGSDLEGTNTVHGKPLTKEQIDNLRAKLNYFVPDFQIDSKLQDYVDDILSFKMEEYERQKKLLNAYKKEFPSEYKELFETSFDFDFSKYVKDSSDSKIDMRAAVHETLNLLQSKSLIGGCADVAPSTKVYFDNTKYFSRENRDGKNIAYGVREHAMGAISNGISLHGGLRSFCSTFFSFANYLTPAIRLSALMKNPVLYIFTHDSIATGEDGPTHQSVEQIATLRAMPGISVFRPCGRNELLAGFNMFCNNNLPMCIVLPRQEILDINNSFENALHGGYKIVSKENSVASLVSTGSDVVSCYQVAQNLEKQGVIVDVISMPCVELFESQDENYKQKVIDKTKKIICVECSGDNIWYKYATNEDCVIKLNSFGLSGKGEEVLDYFGFSVDKLTKQILEILKK